MRADLALLLGLAIPIALAGAVVRVAWPSPRGTIARRLAFVSVAPLVLLSSYLVFEYRTWRWSIFPYGSPHPHAIAGAVFITGLVVIMVRATAPIGVKIVVASVVAVAWAALWFTTALFTACVMGDCL